MKGVGFVDTLEQYGDAPALITEQGPPVTYAELAGRVRRFQERISTGSKLICLQCGLNIPAITCYLAALQAGQPVLLVNPDLSPNKIALLREQYQPEWIFEPVEPRQTYTWEEEGYGLRPAEKSSGDPIHPDLAVLLSTSGTTGSPKMVKLSGKNLDANARSIVEFLGIDRDDRAITSLPMYYSYGLSVINTHLTAGGAVILTEHSMMTREFWDTFRTHKATSLAGVPYHYEMLLRLRFFTMELPSLKTLTQAGGRLNPGYVKKFAEHARQKNIRFFVMYGQTEATARISYLPPERVLEKPESIGLPIPGGKLWLQDDTGRVIEEEDQEGELYYQGANVMMGYADCRKDLAAGDTLHTVLATGDLARRDKDGLYTITGRLKRFVKIFGNRVNLDEVEQLLKSHGIAALCGGEDNKMLIVLTDASVEKEVQKTVAAALGIHHSALTTAVVPEFSYTDTGKIDYAGTFMAAGS